MVYSTRIRTFVIDLDDDEYQRWSKVIAADKRVVIRLAEEADEGYAFLPGFIKAGLGAVLSIGYRLSGGRYQDELRAWAHAMGRSMGEMVLLNCSYEMSHLAPTSVFGCTAGIRWVPKLGMVHVRTLDWPLQNIGPATRIFKYKQGKRSILAVGISGFVGVLSGMLPGAYSATINWAPPAGRPRFRFGPAFLLREVFETCDTYEEAVEILTYTTLSTPVFFTVCGTRKGQACVIERTRKDAAVRKFRSPVLVQANHHIARKFLGNNSEEEGLTDSRDRVKSLRTDLRETSATSLRKIAAACLDEVPVLCGDTVQKMAFCPGTGDFFASRLVD